MRGFTVEELCTTLNIDQSGYLKWEEVEEGGGEGAYNYDVPPAKSLVAEMALLLQFPLAWFYADEIQLSNPGDFSWVSGSQVLDDELDDAIEQLEAREKNEK